MCHSIITPKLAPPPPLMAIHKLFFITLFFFFFFFLIPSIRSANSNLFREYIGAQFNNVKFTDVPINSAVEFHFILSFAIDYTKKPSSSHSPTNGHFHIFWDSDNLTPSRVSSIKTKNPNVKVAVSLGGDTVGKRNATFNPSSIDSWVSNAVASLSRIINKYHLDGIDIDYEHFAADPETFARCVGRLIRTLKRKRVISFASIAPFDEVQRHYLALWKGYGHWIDYVNFQFYAYDEAKTAPQFVDYYMKQSANYDGGKVLVSLSTEKDSGGMKGNEFLTACRMLKRRQKLNGIFVWSADDSKARGFPYEGKLQSLLAISH